MIVYGIKNCNTMKKAFDWLNANGIAFEFHDYKKAGVSEAKLEQWLAKVGIDVIVNRKGTTYKQLTDNQKADLDNKGKAIAILKEKTSMIKRPIIEVEGKIILLGFDEQVYIESFGR